MKKDIFLFYCYDVQPAALFKIKNADTRNESIIVNYRGFYKGEIWKEFLKGFINSHTGTLLNNNISIDLDFEGFILMYDDTITERKNILIDPDKIISTLSE